MLFNDGFVAGRICIDRGRGSAPRKTAVQTQHQETFRRLIQGGTMSEATFEQANLQVKLYDLRREPRLREARDWFSEHFHPQSLDDVMKICPPGSKENAFMRQVLTYWEMVASMSNRGLLDEDLLFESGGEEWATFQQVKPVLAAWREMFASQKFLGNLEAHCRRLETWREKRSPGSNAAIRKVIEQVYQAKQSAKAKAA
jgi:hypothetical protein